MQQNNPDGIAETQDGITFAQDTHIIMWDEERQEWVEIGQPGDRSYAPDADEGASAPGMGEPAGLPLEREAVHRRNEFFIMPATPADHVKRTPIRESDAPALPQNSNHPSDGVIVLPNDPSVVVPVIQCGGGAALPDGGSAFVPPRILSPHAQRRLHILQYA